MSHLEERFADFWQTYYSIAPQPIPQYMFHETKNWKFDFAWLEQMVALEIQGGTFQGGRHSRGASMINDYEKNNAALVMGWRVFYADTTMMSLRNLPIVCDQIESVVSSPSIIADLEKSRWIAILRNLKPTDCFKWRGIEVTMETASRYKIVKNARMEQFKKGKMSVFDIQARVLEHILGA